MDRAEVSIPQTAGSNGHRREGSNGLRLTIPVIWMSVVVEQACLQIWQAWQSQATPVSLRVSPAVYEAVAAARPGEVVHDYPLMLLGLPLAADQDVTTYEPVLVCA